MVGRAVSLGGTARAAIWRDLERWSDGSLAGDHKAFPLDLALRDGCASVHWGELLDKIRSCTNRSHGALFQRNI